MNVYKMISWAFDLMYLLLMIRILMSWIPHNRYHPVISVIYQMTDPILKPFQNIFPTSIGIDFSPIFAFVFLGILKNVILRIL